MAVYVIMPARDEEASIGLVIDEIPRCLDARVIVCDNGSRDATSSVAESRGARVVRETVPGYGRACLRALAALPGDARAEDVIVFIDADHSDYAEEMPRLIEPIESGRSDLVIGSRVSGRAERGALTPQQRCGNAVACVAIRALFGHRYTDLGPFRAIRKDALDRLDMRDQTWGWTVEMQVKALQRGLRVEEVPVSYRRRIGRSKISGTISGSIRAGWKILSTIARLRFSRAR